jgi:ribosomal protein L25 (general stress protein Ctc)
MAVRQWRRRAGCCAAVFGQDEERAAWSLDPDVWSRSDQCLGLGRSVVGR